MDPITLLVIAGSAFLKHQANEQAQNRQRSIQHAMEAYQRDKAHQNEAATEELVKKETPQQRATELSTLTADREKSLRDTVGAAQAFDASPVAGKLSSDYRSTQEANAGRIAERTRRAITQLATMGAPGEQQQKFGLRFGRAAGTVDAGNRAIESVGRGYLNDISHVRPNASLSMAGDIGMTLGGAMGGAGGVPPVNNGQGYEDSSGNLYSDNVTRQQRLNRGFSLWGTR